MTNKIFYSIDNVLDAVIRLGQLADEVVFVGGAVTGFFITDPGTPAMRPTLDIDVIVEIATQSEYYKFQERLKKRGFVTALNEDVLCRYRSGPIILDVMPIDENILGFSNRWYADGARCAQSVDVDGLRFRIVTPEYFLATKFEAFHGRGNNDYIASYDMEDIITVIDGRSEIVEDVLGADAAVREYLKSQFAALLADDDFVDALPGHLHPDIASQKRFPLLMTRIKTLAGS